MFGVKVLGGDSRPGGVRKIGEEETRQAPVMPTVFEDIKNRHCGAGEVVKKERFEFALYEVRHNKSTSELLDT